jgi:hypothetical protein
MTRSCQLYKQDLHKLNLLIFILLTLQQGTDRGSRCAPPQGPRPTQATSTHIDFWFFWPYVSVRLSIMATLNSSSATYGWRGMSRMRILLATAHPPRWCAWRRPLRRTSSSNTEEHGRVPGKFGWWTPSLVRRAQAEKPSKEYENICGHKHSNHMGVYPIGGCIVQSHTEGRTQNSRMPHKPNSSCS